MYWYAIISFNVTSTQIDKAISCAIWYQSNMIKVVRFVVNFGFALSYNYVKA